MRQSTIDEATNTGMQQPYNKNVGKHNGQNNKGQQTKYKKTTWKKKKIDLKKKKKNQKGLSVVKGHTQSVVSKVSYKNEGMYLDK